MSKRDHNRIRCWNFLVRLLLLLSVIQLSLDVLIETSSLLRVPSQINARVTLSCQRKNRAVNGSIVRNWVRGYISNKTCVFSEVNGWLMPIWLRFQNEQIGQHVALLLLLLRLRRWLARLRCLRKTRSQDEILLSIDRVKHETRLVPENKLTV